MGEVRAHSSSTIFIGEKGNIHIKIGDKVGVEIFFFFCNVHILNQEMLPGDTYRFTDGCINALVSSIFLVNKGRSGLPINIAVWSAGS
jgi:hypothetical protein